MMMKMNTRCIQLSLELNSYVAARSRSKSAVPVLGPLKVVELPATMLCVSVHWNCRRRETKERRCEICGLLASAASIPICIGRTSCHVLSMTQSDCFLLHFCLYAG
jgi:hypothetical protein